MLAVDRATLAKRRWQAAASDGTEFGFDLESPLHHGDVIFATDTAQYVLGQTAEEVLSIAPADPAAGLRIAWSLGNLHFPVEIGADAIRVIDDPAVRIFLERDKIPYQSVRAVFHPIRTVDPHGHSH